MSDPRLDAEFQGILASLAEEVESLRSTMAVDPAVAVEHAAEMGVRLVSTILVGRGREWMHDSTLRQTYDQMRGYCGGVAQHLDAIRHILFAAWDDAALRGAFSALQSHAVRLGNECGASWHEVAIHVVARVRDAVLMGMPDDDLAHVAGALLRRDEWFPDAAAIADHWEAICEHLPGLTGADCEALQISLRKERTQRISRSESDSKSDSEKKSEEKLPQNPQVLKLIDQLNKAGWPSGKKREFARELTDGDDIKADGLVKQLKRFPHLHRNKPPKK